MASKSDRRFRPSDALPRHGYPTPGPQSPEGTDVLQDVFFLNDAQFSMAGDKKYDFIVVGTSFCALAFVKKTLQLQPNKRILLLERGPFFLPAHFQTLPRAFAETLGGKSETFPWTVDRHTEMNQRGLVRCCHGSVPFFGGKSTVWSTWCPRPTKREMHGWPTEVITAAYDNFVFAEDLLRVQSADKIDSDMSLAMAADVQTWRPVYGSLQRTVQGLLGKAAEKLRDCGINRIEAARLASADAGVSGVDFLKYSVPGSLLELQLEFPDQIDIKLNCAVCKILSQDGVATALETSCGVLPVNDAKVVLAMGCLPPTTLVRNSFSYLSDKAGAKFSAHFISSVVARVPREALIDHSNDCHQVGACYIAGVADNTFKRQFHIQLSILAASNPTQHAATLLRYMPDVVATASPEQLATSTNHVVLVCAVLGELDADNPDSSFRHNPMDEDLITNSMLSIQSNSEADLSTRSTMTAATFAVLEQIGKTRVEYWHTHAEPRGRETGTWKAERPPEDQTCVSELVHDSSTLPIGRGSHALVDLDYRLKTVKNYEDRKHDLNIFVTGGSLWPRGGSWNPTLTMVALAADLATKLNS